MTFVQDILRSTLKATFSPKSLSIFCMPVNSLKILFPIKILVVP